MSAFFEPESIRAIIGGSFMTRPDHPGAAMGVSIDTRSTRPGQVFVAIPGERVDGHDFLPQAFAAGSSVAIVDRGRISASAVPPGMTVIETRSTRAALLTLAASYRRTLRSTRVIAVTGSNGKTTTVRLIDRVLGTSLRGSASIKSFNNDIGLPLTILNASPADQYLICEIGMNAPGEIRRLATIATPDIAVVTSIGRAHLGRLGSIEAIAHEKMSLLTELVPSGLAVIPDTDLAQPHSVPGDATIIRVGFGDHADIRVGTIEANESGTVFALNERRRFRAPLLGEHNAINAAIAVAVAGRFGLDDADIAAGLSGARGPEMRLERRSVAGIDLINDAYNANPDSTIAAIRSFASLSPGAARRVLILGEMLELDALSADLHAEVGEAIAQQIDNGTGPDLVVLVGRGAWEAVGPIRARLGEAGVRLEPQVGDGRSLAEALRPGDAVLLKGSRGVGLERVIEALSDLSRSKPIG